MVDAERKEVKRCSQAYVLSHAPLSRWKHPNRGVMIQTGVCRAEPPAHQKEEKRINGLPGH